MVAPAPRKTAVSAPFWAGLDRAAVHIQRCRACQRYIFHPRDFCPRCGEREPEWRDVSGRGTVYSFTLAEVPVAADFAHLPPQIIAIVELEEDVRLATTLVGVDPDDVRIGMPVGPVFDRDERGFTLLRFAPR